MTRRGVLVLAGTPIGDLADASPRLAASWPAPTSSPPRTPGGCAGWPPRSGSSSTGRVVSYYDAQRGRPHARAGRGAARRRSGCCWSPTPGCRRSPTPATGWSPRPSRRASRSPPCPARPRCSPRSRCPGLPVDRFCFEGFLPRKAGERRAPAGRSSPPSRARSCSSRRRTGSRTRSPRWPTALGAERPAAVCRELTKTYEEVRRGGLRRAGRLGGRGRPRRDHRRRRRRRARRCRRPGRPGGRGAGAGRHRAGASRRPSPRSRPRTGSAGGELYDAVLAARGTA